MSELEDFREACDMKTWGGRVIAALLDHVAALEQRGGETKPQQESPKYSGATCRGSYVLGTACGVCERCKEEASHLVALPKPAPTPEHTREHCKIHGCIVCAAPTTATVERYTVYGFTPFYHGQFDRDTDYHRKPIGEVVASKGDKGWLVTFPELSPLLYFTDNTYHALVTMQLQSGVWERTNE